MKLATCFISVLLCACTGTGTGGPTPPEPTVLGETETLYGWFSDRIGTDLAFLWDGRLAIGAPSIPASGECFDSSDARCWVTDRTFTELDTETLGQYDPQHSLPLEDDWDTGINCGSYGFGAAVLSPGDVTGDGLPDLAFFDNSDYPLSRTWSVFPEVALGAGYPLARESQHPRAAPCGDVDSNGVDDLCTAEGIVYGPIVAEAARSLSWTAEDPFVTGVDLDGDGVSELAVSDAAAHALYHLVDLKPGGGPGGVVLATVAATTWSAVSGKVTALAAGDLDGDGAQDLVVGWSGPQGDVVLVGLPPVGGDPLAGATTTLPVRGSEFAIADFDGDGQDDLAVGGWGLVTVWLGPLPAGTLARRAASAHYVSAQSPNDLFGSALAAADTDGDGRAELAIGAPDAWDPAEERWNDGVFGPQYRHGRVWWLLGGGL